MKIITRHLPQGSIILAITTLGSYVFGLLRERTLAQTFGATSSLDAYNAAFLIPDFLFNVFVASGIAAAVVPLFIDLSKTDQKKADDYVNNIMTAAALLMAAIACALFVSADLVSALVAPGLSDEAYATTTNLLRILALSPILFSISNTLGAILVARKQFIWYGISPIVYNLGIMGGAILLTPQFGIYGVAIGTLFGALLHLLTRLYDVHRSGFLVRPHIDTATAEFRTTLRLMAPKMIGHPAELATFWGFTTIASLLASGSITVLNIARNFQSVPVSVIGTVLATTLFPVLAHAATDRNPGEFLRALKKTCLIVTGGSIAAAVLIYAIKTPLITVLLGGKAFDAEDISRTAAMLGVFTLSIPTEALGSVIARAFYATKNTTIPMASNVISFILSIGGAYLLLSTFGLLAIPYAFFLGSTGKLLVMLAYLPRQIYRIDR